MCKLCPQDVPGQLLCEAAATSKPDPSGQSRTRVAFASRHSRRLSADFRLPGRLILAGLASFPSFIASTAHAHVRWFVDGSKMYAHRHFSVEPTTMLIMLGALLFIGLACVVERAEWSRRSEAWFVKRCSLPTGLEWRILGFLAGLMLMANVIMRVFLAPNLVLHDGALSNVGSVAQWLVGALLISQVSFVAGGALILLVLPVAACLVPPALLMNYLFEFAALGLALILIGPSLIPMDRWLAQSCNWNPERFAHLALPIIRLGMGLTLVILALDEKLLHPELTVAFLTDHHLNFMRALGFYAFTDLHFTFAAGVAELTFGLLLVSGLATRLVTLALSTFFILTTVILGPTEVVGHAPIFGIVLLLVMQGAGTWRVAAKLQRGTAPSGAPAILLPVERVGAGASACLSQDVARSALRRTPTVVTTAKAVPAVVEGRDHVLCGTGVAGQRTRASASSRSLQSRKRRTTSVTTRRDGPCVGS
mgnify:CR=1 FL=1